jgi:FlaA1/EpsC-like NDP-sugar epimerase
MLSLPGSRSHNRRSGLNTLVVGAGEAGRTLVRALRRSPNYGLVPIGFLDDARGLTRAVGLPVFGPISALAEIARARQADACVVAIPSLPAPRVAEIIETARASGLHIRFLPSFLAAVERDARLSDLRQIRVGDLLGRRELHVVGEKAAALISGRRVLVTGAGGSIGSELCRQINGFGPEALYLLDHDESNLHGLQLDITGNGLLDADEIIIADIRDESRIDQSSTRPRTSTCHCWNATRARP